MLTVLPYKAVVATDCHKAGATVGLKRDAPVAAEADNARAIWHLAID